MIAIVPIVEGHGEIEAVPALLQRMATMISPGRVLRVNHPIRVRSSSFLNDADYFGKHIALAAAKAAQAGGLVLILLDCEDDCPAKVGPLLLQRAQTVRSDVSYLVVLAFREFESWFLASAQSLRGVYGIPHDLDPPDNVEAIRDAKGWLDGRMDRKYEETTHQLEFSKKFDLLQARSNGSFNRFYVRIEAAFTQDSMT